MRAPKSEIFLPGDLVKLEENSVGDDYSLPSYKANYIYKSLLRKTSYVTRGTDLVTIRSSFFKNVCIYINKASDDGFALLFSTEMGPFYIQNILIKRL